MPFYEYRCGSCGHEFEAMQKMSDAPLTHCPGCAEEDLVKLVSAAGFRLKGGGWYATDFKNADGKKADAKKNVDEAGASPSSGGHSCGTGACPSCS